MLRDDDKVRFHNLALLWLNSSFHKRPTPSGHGRRTFTLIKDTKMVLPKSKNAVGLGNSLMNDRFGKGKGSDMRRGPKGIQRTGPDGQTYVTTPKEQAAWVKMRSVTEQNDLDEFLSTAELAGTDFTAEKLNNIKIIHRDQKNPYLLSATEERASLRKQNANKKKLKVPRRPQWDERTTPQELDQRERDSLLEWRRGLAEMQENDDLLMTPFERNLEVWRQLWRVIERSDLVVQIVDARNPLLFRCEDLEAYVKEVDPRKNNLLLVNKADMMTLKQRQTWASYFQEAGINFRFFSAQLAKDLNEARDVEEGESVDGEDDDDDGDDASDSDEHPEQDDSAHDESGDDDDEDEDEGEDDEDEVKGHENLAFRTKKSAIEDEREKGDGSASEGDLERAESDSTTIITTDELEALFLEHSPDVAAEGEDGQPRKTQIGLVGYPNVGKSSTINALIGAKKVSVSATPGKTKHFQTIHLSDRVVLCDCPGLVFPNFAFTKAELVCNGILPIDQLREYSGPAALVAQRIPKPFLEAIYGMRIPIRPLEEGGTGIPTGEEVLRAYATARGFSTTGLGQPDESRAARYVLKDYVKGKLLYCHPPPVSPAMDGKAFNQELYDVDHLPQKRRAGFAADEDASVADSQYQDDPDMVPMPKPQGEKTQSMDKRFFARGQGNAGHLYKAFDPPSLGSGRALTGRKLKAITALEKDVDPADLKFGTKKHFKANKKREKKIRSEYK